ncbi:hypothetical protein EGI22_22150 [Lacihabitans sp. LS3-19]|uniref:hypothetical protein n=1 Tax=Lacihabitans sp. LS3-19 TaxID=2487335 RepID=UPI0020CF2FA1|nr:hypothetical protein [Lacihabitans sp. LS3-19]MCP9770619.1 hypothetical protein [Lacihabitans sp. LS3-19]
MTALNLEKYRTFTLNEKGTPISVSLDLKNRSMKRLFEILMEDFEDSLIAKERQDEESLPWEEVKANLQVK